MLKFVLFAMIGNKLGMGWWYWVTLGAYSILWICGKVMGWLK